MATFKKTASKTTGKRPAGGSRSHSTPDPGERLTRTLSESAQQIWLAGMGAFGRAQAEGTKLFEGLVKEGLNLEQTARKLAGGSAEVVRDAVETKVGHARERAADTWDRLEKVFEERVQRAMVKLGVPGRDDLADLSRRVDTLTAELRRQGGKPSPTVAPRKPAARKTAASKTATSRPAAANAPASKVASAARKPATRAAVAKSPRKPAATRKPAAS